MRDTAINKFTISPSIVPLLSAIIMPLRSQKENMGYRIFLLFLI